MKRLFFLIDQSFRASQEEKKKVPGLPINARAEIGLGGNLSHIAVLVRHLVFTNEDQEKRLE